MSGEYKPRVAVFASGGGTTFRAVADAIAAGLVNFEICLVISDHADAGVLQHVADLNKQHGWQIATEIINKKLYPDGKQGRGQTVAETKATIASLKKHKADHLVLLGCLRIIADQVIQAYGWQPSYALRDPKTKGMYFARMTNTHPGILPATTDTFGIHTQESALQQGLSETAQTFHVVATGVDKGPVVAEHRVKILPGDTPDTLLARVQKVEKANIAFDLDGFLKDQAVFLHDRLQ